MIDGHAVSRTYKPIPNVYVRTTLEKWVPEGMDMELTSGANFQECTGNIMREDGEPEFTVSVIDYVDGALDVPYEERILRAKNWFDHAGKLPFQWVVLTPTIARTKVDIEQYEAQALAAGHEGIMLRKLDAPYKTGRSTFREGILIKVKRFRSTTAVIVDVEEQQHNSNPAMRDAFGRTKRSTAQEGKVDAGTLGALIVRGIEGTYKGVEWSVGTGFDAAQRADFWKRRKEIVGQFITCRYFPTGSDTKPRFPTWVGMRHEDDIDKSGE
jgi:DNA ligase-1